MGDGISMDEVKHRVRKKKKSIKWSFIIYIPLCIILAYAGVEVIGHGSNYLQYKYEWIDWKNGSLEGRMIYKIGYWIVSYAQAFLMPLWVLLSAFFTGALFYKRELDKPIKILMGASEKIADNSLDFHIDYEKNNELGALCASFEKMRDALYQNNKETWRMLEERKKVNAAFAHEMRTPITVLKGYRDLLEKYVPDGVVSEEKMLGILQMMKGQVERLEIYTQKMSALQKLEDLVPVFKEVNVKELTDKCIGIGNMLAKEIQTDYKYSGKNSFLAVRGRESIRIDEELLLEVYENLVSNAVRYADSRLEIDIHLQSLQNNMFIVSVEDDGPGFSKEALENAAKPFYRSGRDEEDHFGLGLYLCKVICEKCGGELIIGNGKYGGKVTASFRIDSSNEKTEK